MLIQVVATDESGSDSDEDDKAARRAKKEEENEKKASEIWKEPLQVWKQAGFFLLFSFDFLMMQFWGVFFEVEKRGVVGILWSCSLDTGQNLCCQNFAVQ